MMDRKNFKKSILVSIVMLYGLVTPYSNLVHTDGWLRTLDNLRMRWNFKIFTKYFLLVTYLVLLVTVYSLLLTFFCLCLLVRLSVIQEKLFI